MNDWNKVKNLALRAAFELRRRFSLARDAPINVFDLCMSLALDVRFLDCGSLDGMYVREPRRMILLPTTQHRPSCLLYTSDAADE